MLPLSRPAIVDGAVLVRGNRIAAVGSWKQLRPGRGRNVADLGDVLLLPGLINAHCHLDYTSMAGTMPPQKSFTDWIKLITTAKAEWGYSDYANSWLSGAGMLVRSGTTTVADFEVIPELLPEVWGATSLRVISFLELTGIRSRRDPRAIVGQALDWIRKLPRGRSRAALGPHAPYSTVPLLLQLAAQAARRHRWPLSVHVAESTQEFLMFHRGSGEMYDWLRRNERDMTDCGRGSPIRHLYDCGVLGRNLIAVHVNYLARHDAALLGQHHVSVAHCPRSHHYFQHDAFPLHTLTRAGVNVCLGTDSLATVYRTRKTDVALSMFDEMRQFAGAHARVAPAGIIEMATRNGARALGLSGKTGEITPGAFADLIAIPYAGPPKQAPEAVIEHRGDVAASLIDGTWAVPPGMLPRNEKER